MKPISKDTYFRALALFIALVNQFLAIFGYSPLPFDSVAVEGLVSTILLGIAAIVAWWKDNDFTLFARKRKAAGDYAMKKQRQK